MQSLFLDGGLFRAALVETNSALLVNRARLNRINIFPVPDGDTGNNLLATLEAALQKTADVAESDLSEVAEAAFRGAREGSCGSSGAIFAQYLGGWAAAFSGLKKAGAGPLAHAMVRGSAMAYRAVLEPVEGTILTVARESAGAAEKESSKGTLESTLHAAYRQARITLLSTARVLPQLGHQAVIDAGGWGLLIFLSSLAKVLQLELGEEDVNIEPFSFHRSAGNLFDFTHPYDMEFKVKSRLEIETKIRALIRSSGSELITHTTAGDCSIHIHTMHPLEIVEKVSVLAPPVGIIIRDMRSQHDLLLGGNGSPVRSYTTIAIGRSPGFLALFAMAGADASISIDNLLSKRRLFEEFSGGKILVVSSEKVIFPVPETSVLVLNDEVRVLAALFSAFSRDKPAPETIKKAAGHLRMARIIQNRELYSALINGYPDQWSSLEQALESALILLEPVGRELMTIYYGKEYHRSVLEKIIPLLLKKFPMLERIEMYFGGQDIPIIVSLE